MSVELDFEIARQRPEFFRLLQGGSQENGVVPVRGSQDPVQRDAAGLGSQRPLHPAFSAVDGATACHSPPPGALVMQPSVRMRSSSRPRRPDLIT
jgi:hypothetical protein